MAATITIRGKKYPEPSVDRLKRKQAKKLQAITKQIEMNPSGMDLDAVWEMVGLMIPKLPVDVLDDLDLGECKTILEESGTMEFADDGGMTPTDSVGESSASSS